MLIEKRSGDSFMKAPKQAYLKRKRDASLQKSNLNKKKKLRIKLGEEALPQSPRTIEGTSVVDETMVQPADVEAVEATDDEFTGHFNKAKSPKILVTTSRNPSKLASKCVLSLWETSNCCLPFG